MWHTYHFADAIATTSTAVNMSQRIQEMLKSWDRNFLTTDGQVKY